MVGTLQMLDLERFASDKRPSLFDLFVSGEENKVVEQFPPRVNVIKLFSFVTDDKAK
jgi:hypothetical protein